MGQDVFFRELIEYIYQRFGLDCSEYNESYIKRRLNARIIANALRPDDYAAYLGTLRTRPEEARLLYDALTINVTQFFRDIRLWDFMARDVLLKIAAEKRARKEKLLQIWSCGCSSGEEPYSLAILVREILGERSGIVTRIIATDIDDQSLQKAKRGLYDVATLKTMPVEYVGRYFHPVQENGVLKYELDSSVRTMVQFHKHNFLREPPPALSLDMVFCRNVIIYFTQGAKDKLMEAFYNALNAYGWLVIGKSEVLFTSKAQQNFYVYNAEERIYRKERRRFEKDTENERRKTWWYGYGRPLYGKR